MRAKRHIKGTSKRVNFLYYTVLSLLILCVITSGCIKQDQLTSRRYINTNEIVVFAAASLTECFSQIKKEYEKEHEDVNIVLNFAGSQVLKNQIQSGANPSMYFSANMKYPIELVESEMVVEGEKLVLNDIQAFVKNQLVIISSNINIVNMNQFIELLKNNKSTIVLAHEDVPVGKYTMSMMDCMRSDIKYRYFYDDFYNQVVSYENDVKAVLAKVKLKEADFGVVYKSDAISANEEVFQIKIPKEFNQLAIYGSLLLKKSNSDNEFYDYVINGNGQSILKEFGFVID